MSETYKLDRTRHVIITTTIALGIGMLYSPLICAARDDGEKDDAPTIPDASSERSLQKRVLVDGSIYDIWAAWTTSEGLRSFFAPASKLELRIGGAWELYMSEDAPLGERGSEGCKLLAYVPYEMLCFEWTSPPKVPELRSRGILTRVVIRMEEAGPDRTAVTITHLGMGDGPAWDKNYEYFDRAWSFVAGNLESTFRMLRSAMRQPSPVLSTKRWHDGAVIVSSHDGVPDRWQEFEIELPATPHEVWQVLATGEGMKAFMGGKGDPEIELKANGKYAIWPAARNRVMSFASEEMLAVSGSAPDKFPNVQQGGTWGVYLIAPISIDRTRLRLLSMGWSDQNDEWKQAYDYFLGANAQYLNMLHKHFGGAAVPSNEPRKIEWYCDVDAAPSVVWPLFTTKSGIESWMVPNSEVDFRVGGTIKTNYDKSSKIGDAGTIVHHILVYEPERMYAGRTDAPENGPVKAVFEQTWGIVYFEQRGADRTRVRLANCGWGRGADWDTAEQFFTWGNRVTLQGLVRRVRGSGTNNTAQAGQAAADREIGG